jgi:DNA-binding MarR family transcriptional regulator
MSERRDLGGQFARITRRLIELEQPILDKHNLSMWEYVVLVRLRTAPAETQLQLAKAIRYDKTRLIALLDGLHERDLIERNPAAADRRAHTIKLTRAGRSKVDAVSRDIHRMEDGLLPRAPREQLQQLLDQL